MIAIDVRIDDRQIATARGVNVSDLSSISDYEIEASSEASPITGAEEHNHSFRIEAHAREQSAWALVAKIAMEAARHEGLEQI